MRTTIDTFTEHYFPFHFLVLGTLGLAVTVVLWTEHPVISVCILLLSSLILSTHYRLSIDLKTKTYKEYLWIAGVKHGETQPFDHFQYAYINRLVLHQAYGFVARINISTDVYKGYLKTSDNHSIYLGKSRRQQNIVGRTQRIARRLDIPCKSNFAG